MLLNDSKNGKTRTMSIQKHRPDYTVPATAYVV